MAPLVGVLALQGASGEHVDALRKLGIRAQEVRMPEDLVAIDGIILPGGESTTISMLLESSGTFEPLSELLSHGLPAFGTCAGMILLSNEVLDGRNDQRSFDRIDIAVRRNAFGRQIASFEKQIDVRGLAEPFQAVFIRSPGVESVGPEVEVLATIELDKEIEIPVLCRQNNILVSSFHPELTDDLRLHQMFLSEL
ncbi:MAG: pyridoxal 5'-phosphate synthase glutaminase subunit PdxT [Actinomycetota bacterium]|nr:pyridoxal 5'-phosphate synthase glutaminase subunit PdxT [Acidimicrobiaceae bacterium]MCS5674821.1 pyridoxal 5'-phosphate synthase glutaminase subunit PdxT [Acidimicrobiales bacterium]MED5542195.1 pyridoxal 5'-phosphate synthase glutaminase subunit PdxT [Actinomycetota bacterium]MEE2806159.1 pyridoxal 5'-phosphate synthase glutaminase subunit PdxT [Actinomycetota bacterium]